MAYDQRIETLKALLNSPLVTPEMKEQAVQMLADKGTNSKILATITDRMPDNQAAASFQV